MTDSDDYNGISKTMHCMLPYMSKGPYQILATEAAVKCRGYRRCCQARMPGSFLVLHSEHKVSVSVCLCVCLSHSHSHDLILTSDNQGLKKCFAVGIHDHFFS